MSTLATDTYRLPHGPQIHRGARMRVPAEMIWSIPAADRWLFDLDDRAASTGSEVLIWPAERDLDSARAAYRANLIAVTRTLLSSADSADRERGRQLASAHRLDVHGNG